MLQPFHRVDTSGTGSEPFDGVRVPGASRFAARCLELSALRARFEARREGSGGRRPGSLLAFDTAIVMAAVAPLFRPSDAACFRRPSDAAGAAVRRVLVPMPGERRLAVDVVPQTLRFDAADLTRLLQELVDNAWRHAPAGGTVRVRGAPGQSGYQLSVTNTGPRLPRWVAGALREVDAGRPPAGRTELQLGLAIASTLTALNDSTLEVVRGGGRPNTLRIIVQPD